MRFLEFLWEPSGLVSPGWAVVVGVDHYEDNNVQPLKQCVYDAISVYVLLTEPDYGGFQPDRVALLLGATPFDIQASAQHVVQMFDERGISVTRQGVITEIALKAKPASHGRILSEVSRMMENADSQEFILFYFAGHGDVKPERVFGFPRFRSYLLPSGVIPALLETTAIGLSTVLASLRRSKAAQKLAVINACYPVLTRAISGITFRSPVSVLAGNRELQPAIEGIFTDHLIEALAQRIKARAVDRVSLLDAYDYMRRSIPEMVARCLPNHPFQVPLLRSSKPGEIVLSGSRTGSQLRGGVSRRAYMAIAAMVVLLSAARWLYPGPDPPRPTDVRLAVFPLKAVDGALRSQDLAFGITDYMSARLAAWDHVRLASSAAITKVSPSSPPSRVSRELGVELILHGTVQMQEQQVSVVLKLENAAADTTVWTRKFDGRVDKLFDLEDEICAELIGKLHLKGHTTPGRELRARTLEVNDLYLKGKRLSQEKPTADTLKDAEEKLRRAIELDPAFVPSYAQRSRTAWQLYNRTKDKTWLELAERMAIQAVSFPQAFVDSYLAMADVHTARGQTEKALEALAQALELAPNSDEVARSLGRLHLKSEQASPAIEAFQKAVRINSNYWNNHFQLGGALLHFQKNAGALCEYKRAIELDSGQADGYEGQATAYLALGNFVECIRAAETALTKRLRPEILSNKAVAHLYLGQLAEERGQFAEARSQFAKCRASAEKSVEEAGKLNGIDEMLLGNLAECHRALGEMGTSNKLFLRALDLTTSELQTNPKTAKALGSQALYFAKTNQFVQAERSMKDALMLSKDLNTLAILGTLLFNKAVIHALADQEYDALDALQEALKQGFASERAKAEPDLRSLRRDRKVEFEALVRRYPTQAVSCRNDQ